MSSHKRKSQKISPEDVKKIRKIDDYFSKPPREQQSNSNILQMKVDQHPHTPKKNLKDQTTPQEKEIIITLDVNDRKNQKMKHVLRHSENASLYTALNTLSAVKTEMKNRRNKEMFVRGIEGIEGFINLGMPLSCFPERSHVVISFSKSKREQKENNQLSGRHDKASTDCIKFYIHAVGKVRKNIVKCRELQKEGHKLCVYGFKGETIKDALCKDGRFLPFLENDRWKLISNLDSVLECSQLVDGLEGKLFQVEAERRKSPRGEAAQNAELQERNICLLKEYMVEEYPSLKRESEKIMENLKEEMKQTKSKTALFKLHRTNFAKETKNHTLVKMHKLLSHLSDSVGYISWNNNGNRGSATCFVLKDSFIVTCRHVINDIVGEGIEPSNWAEIISQCTKVIFDYEEFPVTEENCFFIEPWFEVSDVTLDYAVLELKDNGREVPPGLYHRIGPVPLSGLIYIIGHPNGENKSSDACIVIPKSEREKKFQEHIRAREVVGCSYPAQFIHMYTQSSFQEMRLNPDVVTYDTSFFFGSSGSPVFNSEGSLVAMHTAGVPCPLTNEISVIEFGSSMKAIISDIKQNHEPWCNEVFTHEQDVEMLSQE